MDTTKAQQIALDDALVTLANHLKIRKCNHRVSFDLKSNEPTIQVVLDALKLTPFYNAFQITANVPEIYMQEFWATVSTHHHSLHFKMNDISHTFNVEKFRDMLHICPRLPDNLRLSCAQILWGMYQKKNVDYVYLLWEDLSISRINKMFWHTARDDPMFNTIRVISGHQDTHVYSAVLPDSSTSKAKTMYKKKTDEPITSPNSKTTSAFKGTRLKSKAKVTKPDMKKQPAKKTKAKGLAVLSEVALSEAKQIKLATKRSKKDFHISHASGSGDGVDTQSKVPDEQKTSGTDERTGTIPGVPDLPLYESESDKEPWRDSEEEDDNDDFGDNDDVEYDDDGESNDQDNDSNDERTESDSDEISDPNLTNVDQTEYEEEDVDEGVRTPSGDEFTDEEKLDDEETMDD
uniref:Uncharacterized protein n=1 Tax=Tanacetum cinerariifolium TaxID=118510 RepID=A0A699IH77_TANCI|nr:hypothetical protein [Tanacetum cinerariifolium]